MKKFTVITYDILIYIGVGLLAGVLALPLNLYVFKTSSSYDILIKQYMFVGLLFVLIPYFLKKYRITLQVKKEDEKK